MADTSSTNEATVSERSTDGPWHPWAVAPSSGFESVGRDGHVDLRQVSASKFDVLTRFRFSDDRVVEGWRKRLRRRGVPEDVASDMVERARTYDPPRDDPTDLASVPWFMRWFENSYGPHTLAAILHDELIRTAPNAGALGSDAFADRFFRQMMRDAGVRRVKRWIMWAAVALRTRNAAGGYRQVLLWLWGLLATFGISLLVWSVVAWIADSALPFDRRPWETALFAIGLAIAASALWGKQFGAGLVAAPAALFILPPAIVVGVGYGIYWLLEGLFRVVPGR